MYEPKGNKRETMLSEGMADRIIGLYALGTSTRDISSWLEENWVIISQQLAIKFKDRYNLL